MALFYQDTVDAKLEFKSWINFFSCTVKVYDTIISSVSWSFMLKCRIQYIFIHSMMRCSFEVNWSQRRIFNSQFKSTWEDIWLFVTSSLSFDGHKLFMTVRRALFKATGVCAEVEKQTWPDRYDWQLGSTGNYYSRKRLQLAQPGMPIPCTFLNFAIICLPEKAYIFSTK